MRKIFISILLGIVASGTALAHTIGVGYVNRRVGDATGKNITGKTWAEAAISIDAAKLALYKGNAVQTVRVSLPATKLFVDSVVVWVRTAIDGENIAKGKATRFADDGLPTMKQGWNELALDTPVAIDGTQALYVGYTYYQRTKVCATQAVMGEDAGTSYLRLGEYAKWVKATGMNLAIEAGIDGTQMPQNDVWLMSAKGTILADGTRQVEARLYNRGQLTARSLTFGCTADGYNSTTAQTTAIEPDCLDTLFFNIDGADALTPGTAARLNVGEVNGSADENDADNTVDYLFNYMRIVLIEEFTTEQCPKCPAAAKYLHDIAAEDQGLAKQMAVVCHHAGFNTDRFTNATATEYLWFYYDGTYAPAMMFNRTPDEYVDETTPVIFPQDKEFVRDEIKTYADAESALIITADAKFADGGKRIDVTVNGRKLRDFGYTDKRITVFLTEDNVLADGQAGSGTDTYYHQHVMRAINATWGVPVEWDGDTFTYSCQFDTEGEWKPADLKVIASVGDYDSTDRCNCNIENSAVAVPQGATGIDTARSQGTRRLVARTTVDGRTVQSAQRGIIIERYSDGTARKVVNVK